MPLVRSTPDKNLSGSGPTRVDLRSPSADARWEAARAAESDPSSVPALAEALGRETDRRVREAMFTALASIASPECVDVVLPFLRSDDAAIRTSAIDALRAMPKSTGARLVELFADPDSDVRLLSCELARGLDPTEAQRLLISLIGSDREANVCAAAIEVLSEIGDAAALPQLALCRARFRDDPFIAFAVQAASDRIGCSGDRG